LRLELAARRRDRRLAARFLACEIELAPHGFALVGDLKSTFEHQHGRRWLAVEPQRSAQVVQRLGVAQAGFADWLEAGVEPHAGGGQRSLEHWYGTFDFSGLEQLMPTGLQLRRQRRRYRRRGRG